MVMLHPREKKVRSAKSRLNIFLHNLREDLTPYEFLQVLSEVTTDEWHSYTKYGIREERHPGEPDKPGGLV